MGFLDVTIVNIAFPDIQRDLSGTSLAELSWILNAYAIVFAALLVPAGRIADRIGRRWGFVIGLVVFAVASALCAVAPSPELLVAARVIQAGGAAFLVPTSLALLLPAFPHFTPDGWGVRVHPPVEPAGERLRDRVQSATQALADTYATHIAAHPEDWHMLQRLWLADLEPERAERGEG